MGAKDHSTPPSDWAGATGAGGDVYWLPGPPEDDGHPLIFHWCPANERWYAAGTRDHAVISTAPLTLSPSLLWTCCNKHGFIEGGTWRAV